MILLPTDYYIQANTFSIQPYRDPIFQSVIYNIDGTVHYDTRKPMEIIEASCLHYGSSLEGRRASISRYLHQEFRYQVPVVICHTKEIALQPLMSYRHLDCSWVNIQHIASGHVEYHYDQNEMIVVFPNGVTITVACSKSLATKSMASSYIIFSRLGRVAAS